MNPPGVSHRLLRCRIAARPAAQAPPPVSILRSQISHPQFPHSFLFVPRNEYAMPAGRTRDEVNLD
jgi:hypothetical protein